VFTAITGAAPRLVGYRPAGTKLRLMRSRRPSSGSSQRRRKQTWIWTKSGITSSTLRTTTVPGQPPRGW